MLASQDNSAVLSAAKLTDPNVDPVQKTRLERNRVAMTWISFVALISFCLVTRSRWEPGTLGATFLLFSGLSLAFIGCVGRIWCGLFIDGLKTRELVTIGPYSMCRNPLYLFSAIGVTGIALGSCTLTLPIVVVAVFAAFYPFVIQVEESRLRCLHGDVFDEYCRSVPAFLPLGRLTMPHTATFRPASNRNSIIRSSWFVWLTMLLHWIFEFHHTTTLLPESLIVF